MCVCVCVCLTLLSTAFKQTQICNKNTVKRRFGFLFSVMGADCMAMALFEQRR